MRKSWLKHLINIWSIIVTFLNFGWFKIVSKSSLSSGFVWKHASVQTPVNTHTHTLFIQAENLDHRVEFSLLPLMCLQVWLFIYPPLVVWKVQATAAPWIPTVHKHINMARAHNAALLIDRNPKFLQWKCLCSPSAATQWARLSGVGWRHCERRPSLIPHIAQRRRWPWQEAIKNVLHRHVCAQSPWCTKTQQCCMQQNMFQSKFLA